jgi:uncharacterized protein
MEMLSDNPCKVCKGTCCRSVSVEWNEPTCESDWQNLKWLVAHKNVNVYKDYDGDWLVEFISDCEHLDADNRCSIYEKRMEICRDHPTEDCERYTEGEYSEIIFRNLADVEAYLAGKESLISEK